ncbi:distal tail protein Dit [Streptococcus iniae]|uniref:distal tail protein Dit n=1 Tax=Streptococcus iniae TaxID=1346 RepID=UPI000EFB64DA|nr:distal tail protein Dit [Streptococcus iniae]RMI77658.1 phage tail protein [Streptococcus iniae]
MIKPTFDGKELNITALDGFTLFGGADFDITSKDIASSNGSIFLKKRFKQKVIPVPFFVEYNSVADYDALQSILNVNEPKKLTFSHVPDRYFMAVPVGKIDFREFRMNGKGTITFLIPDGVAHSVTYKKATVMSEPDGKQIFEVTNNGNTDAFPIITIKHGTENGYLGLVNQTGIFEAGSREETDRETVNKSEILLDYRDDKIVQGFNDAQKNVAINNTNLLTLKNTLSVIDLWDKKHIKTTYRNVTGYNGGSLTWPIPADSKGEVGSLNDCIWWRQTMWNDGFNQYGFIQVTVSDENDQFLYGVETYKRSQGIDCEYNILASDGNGSFEVLKRFTFKGTNESSENPFNTVNGFAEIKRNDDKLSVAWKGSSIPLVAKGIKGRKSKKIHVIIGSVGSNQMVAHLYLDSLYYRKDFIESIEDVPNRFSAGSEVVINSENDTFTIDGIKKISEIIDIPDFIKIPPGKTNIELYTSPWVESKPQVEIKFEERYL